MMLSSTRRLLARRSGPSSLLSYRRLNTSNAKKNVQQGGGTAGLNNPPRKSNEAGGGIGKFLIAGAITANIVYIGYQTKYNEEFRAVFHSWFPSGHDFVVSLVLPDGPEETIDGVPVSKVKAELEDLATRWEGHRPHIERFSKQEVKEMQAKVKAAVKETFAPKVEEKRDESSETTSEPEPAAETPVTEEKDEPDITQAEEVEVEEEEAPVVAPTRAKLEAVRAKARKVKARAGKNSQAEIKRLEKELRADIELVLSEDLTKLDEAGLRKRIVELVLELRDRSRWEALRLHEITQKHTETLVKKYDALLREQEEKYEELVRGEAARAAADASQFAKAQADERLNREEYQWHRNAEEKMERQRKEMVLEMEKRFAAAKASIEQNAAEEISRRMETLNALKEKFKTLQQASTRRNEKELLTAQLCDMSIATMELYNAIQTHPKSIAKEIDLLRKASKNDLVVNQTLDSLSARVQTSGVPSELELIRRFEGVYDQCARAALVPEDAGVIEHAAANLVAKLTILGGDASKQQAAHPQEAILAKARIMLFDNNDLDGALKEMEKLTGLVKATASDWVAEAKSRVEVEQAVNLVKSHIISLQSSN